MRQSRKEKSFVAVSANLRAIRGEQSQSEFAAWLGINNQVTYHRYESGRVPKAHILQQIASRLGIGVDELLSPISANRAAEISVRSRVQDISPKATVEGSSESAIAASGSLINDKSVKAIIEALQLDRATTEELSHLFKHVVSTVNRSPKELMKYYVVIRYAVMVQLKRNLKIK